MRLVLAGGGTFGHVGPLLATAAELQRQANADSGGSAGAEARGGSTGGTGRLDRNGQADGTGRLDGNGRSDGNAADGATVALRVVGTTEGLEATMVPAAGLELVTIPKVPLPRRPGTYALRFPGLWRQAMRRLDALLREFAPDAVVGFGGYTATPVYRAAFKAGLPVVVHEANARPGLANRYGAKHAAAVGVAFPGTPLPGAQVVGMPLRRELADLNRAAARAGARAALGLDPDRPTLLVSGGSLGALRLNRDVVSLAPALLEAGTQVLHLTGRGKAEAIRAALSPNELQHYHIREYLPQMEWALAAADLAVQRAGAGTVSELACAALPAVLVPLDVGNGEQRLNAAALTEAGGAVLVSGAEFKDWATQHLVELLTAPDRLEQMAQAAGSVAIHDGAQQLVELIRGVCR